MKYSRFERFIDWFLSGYTYTKRLCNDDEES